MSESSNLAIEVAYAEPGKHVIIPVQVPEGTSVWDAVKLSGILEKVPGIDLQTQSIGVYGKIARKAKQQMVKEGDRVEIYRPVNSTES